MTRKLTPDQLAVSRAYRGQLSKPVRQLSPSYVARLARAAREARARGERPTRQVARGHAPVPVVDRSTGEILRYVTTEHPKEYVRRDGRRIYGEEIAGAKLSPIRKGPADRHVAGHAILTQRDFVRLYPAWRWAVSHDPVTGIQAIGHGQLQDEWVKRTGSGIPPGADLDRDEDEDEDEPELAWRPFYTGNAAGDADENGATFATYADAKAARDTVFVPGTVESYIVRRQ